jgi:hypothetical protein
VISRSPVPKWPMFDWRPIRLDTTAVVTTVSAGRKPIRVNLSFEPPGTLLISRRSRRNSDLATTRSHAKLARFSLRVFNIFSKFVSARDSGTCDAKHPAGLGLAYRRRTIGRSFRGGAGLAMSAACCLWHATFAGRRVRNDAPSGCHGPPFFVEGRVRRNNVGSAVRSGGNG